MPSWEFNDWALLVGPIALVIFVLVILKVAYTTKQPIVLPSSKPSFCFLPKYTFNLPLTGKDLPKIQSVMIDSGFRESRSSSSELRFERGSALGDISIKIAKLLAAVKIPASGPLEMSVEYGVVFGAAFDTGDLWKFCRELEERIQAGVQA